MLGSPGGVNAAARVLPLYFQAIACGQFTDVLGEVVPRHCAVMIMIVYFHLTAGAPLHIDDELLVMWRLGDGSSNQCLGCGYIYPAPVTTKCSLCGGELGKTGTWSQQRRQ